MIITNILCSGMMLIGSVTSTAYIDHSNGESHIKTVVTTNWVEVADVDTWPQNVQTVELTKSAACVCEDCAPVTAFAVLPDRAVQNYYANLMYNHRWLPFQANRLYSSTIEGRCGSKGTYSVYVTHIDGQGGGCIPLTNTEKKRIVDAVYSAFINECPSVWKEGNNIVGLVVYLDGVKYVRTTKEVTIMDRAALEELNALLNTNDNSCR